MATAHLPEQPNIDQLRNLARDLQRGVRRGDPRALRHAGLAEPVAGYRLSAAQRAVARRYGFASWPRLRRHVEAITGRTWTPEPPRDGEPGAYLRMACLNFSSDSAQRRADAAGHLAAHPDLTAQSMAIAAACADVEAVRAHLAADPARATAPDDPYGWSPLMYAAYVRPDASREATVTTARLLLDAGADPNDGRFFRGLATPFTVLTGVLGGGEVDQPPHQHVIAFASVLLEAGADPNDGQALYNRMFGEHDDFLELLLDHGLGRGDGGPWRRLLPDLLPSPSALVRQLLVWAITHDQLARIALLAERGADVIEPMDGLMSPWGFAAGRTPLEIALRDGHGAVADLLRDLGAREPALDPVEEFVAAALAGDTSALEATPVGVIHAARAAHPALVVRAASRRSVAAVEVLAAAGFDLDALGRSDVPVEAPWQTPLHTAVERGDAALVRRLLELGADREVRDARFDASAADWARHFGRADLAEMIEGTTTSDPADVRVRLGSSEIRCRRS